MSRINWVAHNYIEGEQDNLIEETSATKKEKTQKTEKPDASPITKEPVAVSTLPREVHGPRQRSRWTEVVHI